MAGAGCECAVAVVTSPEKNNLMVRSLAVQERNVPTYKRTCPGSRGELPYPETSKSTSRNSLHSKDNSIKTEASPYTLAPKPRMLNHRN